MNKFFLLTILFSHSVFAATPYIGLEVGGNIGTDTEVDQTIGNYSFGINGGFSWESWDANVRYRFHGPLKNKEWDIEAKTQLFDISGRYKLALTEHWDFLVGGGYSYWNFEKSEVRSSNSVTGWSPHFTTGVEYHIDDNWATGVSYTYTHSIGDSSNGEYDSNAVSWTISYRFGRDANQRSLQSIEAITENNSLAIEEPIEEAKEIIPLVPISCPTKTIEPETYLFAFDSASAMDYDVKQIEVIKEQLKKAKDYTITVYGYADPLGPEAYNNALSLRRAKSVAELYKGVGLENIITLGKGIDYGIASNEDKRRAEVIIEIDTCVSP